MKRKRTNMSPTFTVSLVFTFLLFFSSSIYADGTLTIQVLDCNNDPVAGAFVNIAPATKEAYPGPGKNLKTNDDGILVVDNLGGTYTIMTSCGTGGTVTVDVNPSFYREFVVIRCCNGKLEIVDRWDVTNAAGKLWTGSKEVTVSEFERPFGSLSVHVTDCNDKDLPGKSVTLSHPNSSPPPPNIALPARLTGPGGFVSFEMLTARNNYTVTVVCPPTYSRAVNVPAGGRTSVLFKCPVNCSDRRGGWMRTLEEWDGKSATERPDGKGGTTRTEGIGTRPPSFQHNVAVPPGSRILTTPVAFSEGALTGVVIGPDGHPLKDVSLTISGTVTNEARTDENGKFTIPVSGVVDRMIGIAAAGVATAAAVRIVKSVGPETSTHLPEFVQPGEKVVTSSHHKQVLFEQNSTPVDLHVATATGPGSGQSISTFETPYNAVAGPATWKLQKGDGTNSVQTAHVFRIVNKQIDDQSLKSGQNAKFSYDLDFGIAAAGKAVAIAWATTGPIILRNAAAKQIKIQSDGRCTASGEVRAGPVTPATSEPFTITPKISGVKGFK